MGVWISGSPMKQKRICAASVKIGDKIYCSGGTDANTSLVTGSDGTGKTMEIYDLATDSWSMVDMPGYKAYHAMVAWENRLYLLGGLEGTAVSKEVWAYDPATGSWEDRESMPIGVHVFSAEYVQGKIYCMGGRTVNGGNAGGNAFQIYDIAADQWEAPKTIEETICLTSSMVDDDKIYLFGGYNGSAQSKVRIYDPQTGLWSSVKSMDSARSAMCITADGAMVYLMGGSSTGGNIDSRNNFWVYDMATDEWRDMPVDIPVKKCCSCAENWNGHIYLFGGGAPAAGVPVTNQLDIYIPEDILTVTCCYLDQNGTELLPDFVTEVTAGDPFAADAPAVSGYTFVGSRVDDGDTLPQASVTIAKVTGDHIITFVYRGDGVTQPGNGGCCCCGSVKLEINIPITNNREMLQELKDIVQMAKGCDSTCDA